MNATPLAHSILRLIWREQRISRAEIARRLELSRSTVTEIVRDLLETGFIVEAGMGASSGGRRPIVLEFQDDARVLLGIDVGATHVSAAVTDMRGQVLAWKEEPHPVRGDPDGTIELVGSIGEAALAAVSGAAERLLGVGIAVPSPVAPPALTLLTEAVAPAWGGRVDIPQLETRFGVRVHLGNDANLGALAEHWWGAGHAVNDFVYVKSGYGIGAGYILDGNLYSGADGQAGEIGHLSIDPEGPECGCGQRGCLVQYAGGKALRSRAKALLAQYPSSLLHSAPPSLVAIQDAAIQGDELASRLIREAGLSIGTALAGFVTLLNPRVVILGGSMARTGNVVLEAIQERIVASAWSDATANLEVRLSELGACTVALGAATLALMRSFVSQELSEVLASS